MDATPASPQNCAARDRHLRQLVRDRAFDDPEHHLFELLVECPPDVHAATPLLYDVAWAGGRFDLLFTDGKGRWCAVELKAAPAIYGSGSCHRNRKEKHRKRRRKLERQTWFAAWRGSHTLGLPLVAIGLWLEDGEWREIARFRTKDVLAPCA